MVNRKSRRDGHLLIDFILKHCNNAFQGQFHVSPCKVFIIYVYKCSAVNNLQIYKTL